MDMLVSLIQSLHIVHKFHKAIYTHKYIVIIYKNKKTKTKTKKHAATKKNRLNTKKVSSGGNEGQKALRHTEKLITKWQK